MNEEYEAARAIAHQISVDAEEQFNIYWADVEEDLGPAPAGSLPLKNLLRRSFIGGWQACVIHLLKKDMENR